jgi:hypothetical protein
MPLSGSGALKAGALYVLPWELPALSAFADRGSAQHGQRSGASALTPETQADGLRVEEAASIFEVCGAKDALNMPLIYSAVELLMLGSQGPSSKFA